MVEGRSLRNTEKNNTKNAKHDVPNLLQESAKRSTEVSKKALNEVFDKVKEKIEEFTNRGKKATLEQKNIEYDAEKRILAKHLDNVKVEDISQVKKTKEGYSYTDKGENRQEITDKGKLNNIEADLTSLKLKKEPVPDAVEKPLLDHLVKQKNDENLKNGIVHSFDKQNDQIKIYVVQEVKETENGSGAEKIKDGEMKEFSIDLKTLPSEEKTILIDQVKKHLVEEQIKNDIKGTGGTFVDGSLVIKGNEYYYENQNGNFLSGKLDKKHKEDLEKYISYLGLDDNKELVSGLGKEVIHSDGENVRGQNHTEGKLPETLLTTNDVENPKTPVEQLEAEKKKSDRDHKRLNNFLMGLRIANDSALQSSQVVESVLIARLLQTEDTGSQQMPPGSMVSQGLIDRHHEHGRRQSKMKQRHIESVKNGIEEKNEFEKQKVKPLENIINRNGDSRDTNSNAHDNPKGRSEDEQ